MNKTFLNVMKKYIIMPVTAASISIGYFAFIPQSIAYAAVIYEKKETEIVTKGVTYERSRQATDQGLLDVHVLTVDIKDPYIDIKPAQSINGYGLKENVTTLLNDTGAVAGVNADYFDMSANPVTSFGPVTIDGKVVSADNTETGYASFYIDQNSNPFIEYVEPEILFLNNGVSNIKLHSYNKFKTDFTAMAFDRTAITDTASFDQKWPDAAKIVVENGVIKNIVITGETVTVPENGYVILVASTYFQYFADSVKVGDTAEIKVTATFDYDAIATAIGGAGKILQNGQFSNTGYVVGPTARHPRTAIGISQDKSKVILAVVDGRSHSIGATHEEMSHIMLKFGAYDAMQLDGGGSSAMAVNAMDDTALSIVNTLSEGSQRKVVNALGVYNSAPQGEITGLMLNTETDIVFNGSSVKLYPYGVDEYYNKIGLPAEGLTYSSNDPNGRFEGNVFYPGSIGNIVLSVSYNGLVGEKTIENTVLAQLDPPTESLQLSIGATYTLNFSGISTSGDVGPVTGVQYEVVPPELGTVVDNVFTAKGGQFGYIKCSVGGVSTYIDVSLGTKTEAISSFNTPVGIEFIASGETVKGSAYFTDTINSPGNNAIALDYSFGQSSTTQAAYVKFNEPIAIKKGASGFVISAYGDGSGRWLRARLVDAEGTEFLVDLTKELSYVGWQQLNASIPAEAVQPVNLERLYIAALSNSDTGQKQIYFDDLMGVYTADYGIVAKPESSKYTNPFQMNLEGAPAAGIDLTFTGNIASSSESKPENYTALQNKAMETLKLHSSKPYVAGNSDLENTEGVAVMGKNYVFSQENNYAVVRLSAANGGLAATSPLYWVFANESKNSPAQHIIIVIDKKPSNFTYSKEFALFQDALEEIKSTGKNVFVVSTEGMENSTMVRNGVNYINLGSMFKSDGTLNEEFSILRFRVNGMDIRFDMQKVF